MNIIFSILMIVSIFTLIFTDPNLMYNALLTGSKNAIHLALELIAIYGIWLSILNVLEKIKADKMIEKMTYPITHKLFPSEDKKTLNLISLNFASNLLGMGGVATPLGIKAVENMNKDSVVASNNSILFTVINATSIQLLPATIIGLRSTYGASNPSDIILPSLIATSIATIIGIILCKMFGKSRI